MRNVTISNKTGETICLIFMSKNHDSFPFKCRSINLKTKKFKNNMKNKGD